MLGGVGAAVSNGGGYPISAGAGRRPLRKIPDGKA
jgi:hypothetical protein